MKGRGRGGSSVVNSNLQCSVEDRGDTNRLEESNHYPNPQERQQKSLQELQRECGF